ncbi:hypothetical protein ACP4OV_009212 [Aristida adscensionis]
MHAQKNDILNKCGEYIKVHQPATIRPFADPDSCCQAVYKVPYRDMRCIARYLTPEEKTKYNITLIEGIFHVVCKIHPPPPPSVQPSCTQAQKEEILDKCSGFLNREPSSSLPAGSMLHKPCCLAVREVPNKDMPCIVSLLKDTAQEEYLEERVMALQTLCKLPP